MKNETAAVSETHRFTVGTSTTDGHMYLKVEDMIKGEISQIKLTEENRACLRKVLSGNERWSGIL